MHLHVRAHVVSAVRRESLRQQRLPAQRVGVCVDSVRAPAVSEAGRCEGDESVGGAERYWDCGHLFALDLWREVEGEIEVRAALDGGVRGYVKSRIDGK